MLGLANERTLLFVVRTYAGGTIRRTLLFEYSLDNTWTYKTPSEPMYKNQRMYAKVARHSQVRQGVVGGFSL
jgi:hypothetical protein